MAFAHSNRLWWLCALVWMLGCSQASDGRGTEEGDASIDEAFAASEAPVLKDDEESAQEISTMSGELLAAGIVECGRSGYTSPSCPNVNGSAPGWPQTPRNGVTYSTTGWQGGGQVGPGLANRWVTFAMNRTSSTGDPDLYVKKNGFVSTSVYDCRPWTASNPEYCAFYLASDSDYLTWGIDVYSVSPTLTLTIDARACAAGTVYTGVASYESASSGTVYPPPAMTCCACAEGYVETGRECCREIVECTQPSDCASGFCVDGYCCNKACSGSCERCDLAGNQGLCRTIAANSAGSPSCSPYVCNGTSPSCPSSCTSHSQCASGHYCNGTSCVPKLVNGSVCSSAAQCQANICKEGFCCDAACGNYLCIGWTGSCPTSCSSDASCVSTAFCNTNNLCTPKLSNGSVCTGNNQCGSGFCADGVCCNAACTGGACDRCDLPGSIGTCKVVIAGSAGQPSCSPYVCNGSSAACPTSCVSDINCALGNICKAGFCAPKSGNGAACASGNECQSGICAGGICCDSSCTGACERCDLAGSKGTCRVMSAGAESPSCGNYLCDGNASFCPSSCVTDSSCTPSAHCYAGKCHPKSANGMACGSSQECGSGFCVDGTCCESACDGQCQRCDAPGALGICSLVQGQPIGERSPCADDGSVCGGACDGKSATCTYPGEGVGCGHAGCSNGVERREGKCSGAGKCTQETRHCAPYACDGASCRSSCATTADCSASGECIDGECKGALANGEACQTGGECQSSHCIDGVCCGSACDDPCAACNVEGSRGICLSNVKPGCSSDTDDTESEVFPVKDDEGGCGCRVKGGGASDAGRVVLVALAVGLTVMRRRKSGSRDDGRGRPF